MTSKDANQEVEIARCHKGQYFGELALVTNKPRAASAYAVGEVKCLGKDFSCHSPSSLLPSAVLGGCRATRAPHACWCPSWCQRLGLEGAFIISLGTTISFLLPLWILPPFWRGLVESQNSLDVVSGPHLVPAVPGRGDRGQTPGDLQCGGRHESTASVWPDFYCTCHSGL